MRIDEQRAQQAHQGDGKQRRALCETLNVIMKWSKLKQLVEERVTASMRPRFAIYSTAYGNCSCGHAWITIDKKLIANFCTRAFYNRDPKFESRDGRWFKWKPGEVPADLPKKVKKYYENQPVEYGELRRQDVYKACWEFIHDLSINEALESDDPLIQTLAVIDSRVGKKRMTKINIDELHPLAQRLFLLRAESEGITFNKKLQPSAESAG